VAPSAVESVALLRAVKYFAPPRALTPEEIELLIARYATTARLAKEAGFTGVQLHGAHGYLVSQFLSPLTNHRGDAWGGSLENRARFARRVIQAMREAVGPDFPVGIKLNSADFQRGGMTTAESMDVVCMLEEDGVDLIEISGEATSPRPCSSSPTVRTARASGRRTSSSTPPRCGPAPRCPSWSRGDSGARRPCGERSRTGRATSSAGRPLATEPDLSRRILEGRADGSRLATKTYGLEGAKLDYLSEGGFSVYQIHRLARGREPIAGAHIVRATAGAAGYLVQDYVRLGVQRLLARGKGAFGE